MTSLKQDIRIKEYYDLLIDLPDQFKVKQVDIDRGDLHTLRCADIIQKVPDAMGKETVWTLDDEIAAAIESRDEAFYDTLPSLDNDQIYFFERHEDVFGEEFPPVMDDEFFARELDLLGRTPEGMDKYGFLRKVETKAGYANKWKLTNLGKRLVKYKA